MRNFAQYTTNLYRDPDFTSLTFEQQGVYFMLGLQPEISAAGTLPLTVGRWSKFGADCKRSQLEDLIVALGAHAGRHVVIDEDTEELLIRKFMKWDGGWYNEKRAPVVATAIRAISSVHIRDIAVDELQRLIPSHALSQKARDALSVALPDTQCRNDRLRVNLGDHSALDLNLKPEPGASAPVTADAAASPPFNPKRCKDHQTVDIPGNCGNCKDARETEERRAIAELERGAEARKAQAAAILACTLCDEFGRRLSNGVIVSRVCDHGSSAVGAK